MTLAEAVARVAGFARDGRPCHVVTANAEIIMLAEKDRELAAIIRRASLVTGDGAGVVWASRLLGDPLPERVTGIDLAEALFARCSAGGAAGAGFRFFFLGARPGVAEQAARAVQSRFPGVCVAGWGHGYFASGSAEERDILSRINQVRPDILLVAMGAPRQEKWIARHLAGADLDVGVAIGVGGSFDVWAGVARRAPGWVRSLSLEWAYRLAREPARLKRAGALPRFMLAVLAARQRL